MPVLPGVAQTNRFAIDQLVGQDHDLGQARFLVDVGHVYFERAEFFAELLELQRREHLFREAQHAIFAQPSFDGFVMFLGQWL